MVDALFFRLHMPVKHRGIRAQPGLMRLFRDAQPHLPAHFVVANNLAHPRMKNLRSSARQRIHARFLHLPQSLFNRKFRDARKVSDFHHGEGLQMHARAALF